MSQEQQREREEEIRYHQRMDEQAQETAAIEEYWQEIEEWALLEHIDHAKQAVYTTDHVLINPKTKTGYAYATAYFDEKVNQFSVIVCFYNRPHKIAYGSVPGPYWAYCAYNAIPDIAQTLLDKFINDYTKGLVKIYGNPF